MMGDDDCLYLNVYTPDLNQDAKRAVMVFIHPGGFNAGSGNDDIFGPDFIIEQDVILVTFNHRLGATGELILCFIHSHGDAKKFSNPSTCMKHFFASPRISQYQRCKCPRKQRFERPGRRYEMGARKH